MLVEVIFKGTNMSVHGDDCLGFNNSFSLLEICLLIMLLKSSILDSQSFVLHENGIDFHQECNGSIHAELVTMYDVYGAVRYD